MYTYTTYCKPSVRIFIRRHEEGKDKVEAINCDDTTGKWFTSSADITFIKHGLSTGAHVVLTEQEAREILKNHPHAF